MSGPSPQNAALIDHALVWIERLRDGETNCEAFFDWLTESPRHVEVFLQAIAIQQRLAMVSADEWMRVAAALGDDPAPLDPGNVVPLPGATAPPQESGHRSSRRYLALAAAVALVSVTVWQALPWLNGWRTFDTAIGEQRTVQLQDGSVLNLNTDTRVEVRMSAQGRDVRLVAGEALFKVQGNPARPFRVHAHGAVIEALGTQFNVYRRASATTVSVLEGRVRIASESELRTKVPGVAPDARGKDSDNPASAALAAGEQAAFGHDGQLQWRARLTARATAWQQRRLIFDEEPLSVIVTEFNRYNRRPFQIEDASAAERRFSGIFDADDPDSLAQLLSRDARLTVDRGMKAVVVRSR